MCISIVAINRSGHLWIIAFLVFVSLLKSASAEDSLFVRYHEVGKDSEGHVGKVELAEGSEVEGNLISIAKAERNLVDRLIPGHWMENELSAVLIEYGDEDFYVSRYGPNGFIETKLIDIPRGLRQSDLESARAMGIADIDSDGYDELIITLDRNAKLTWLILHSPFGSSGLARQVETKLEWSRFSPFVTPRKRGIRLALVEFRRGGRTQVRSCFLTGNFCRRVLTLRNFGLGAAVSPFVANFYDRGEGKQSLLLYSHNQGNKSGKLFYVRSGSQTKVQPATGDCSEDINLVNLHNSKYPEILRICGDHTIISAKFEKVPGRLSPRMGDFYETNLDGVLEAL